MPIYEFYCSKCNTLFKFFSRSVNTEKVPDCPACRESTLNRRMSLFAHLSGEKDSGKEGDMPPVDEAKMERAMAMLAGEAEKINEDDPRQAARLMRKLSDATGMRMGDGMEEALRRLEKGEDPDQIEQEMGDIFEGEDPFSFESRGTKGAKKKQPRIDDNLYEM